MSWLHNLDTLVRFLPGLFSQLRAVFELALAERKAPKQVLNHRLRNKMEPNENEVTSFNEPETNPEPALDARAPLEPAIPAGEPGVEEDANSQLVG